jgi:hypothetical protein
MRDLQTHPRVCASWTFDRVFLTPKMDPDLDTARSYQLWRRPAQAQPACGRPPASQSAAIERSTLPASVEAVVARTCGVRRALDFSRLLGLHVTRQGARETKGRTGPYKHQDKKMGPHVARARLSSFNLPLLTSLPARFWMGEKLLPRSTCHAGALRFD